MNDYLISTDKQKLDIPLVHDYLSNHSYWAKGRSLEAVKKSIEHSLCFGVYHNESGQVGFARLITDFSTFGYIADVFILEEHRGKGLSKRLIAEIINYPGCPGGIAIGIGLRRVLLATRDAHTLYEKFGFKSFAAPERWMEIYNG